jgi:6-pyruvoyltetrahydropterin/6-carboxytetrahydropterin synthase
MYRLRKKFTFEASHALPEHNGKCRRLHGHSWVGWLVVEGESLTPSGPKVGMLVDYGDLSAAIRPIVENHLDHWHLNESTGLPNPTSECLAKWIYDKVKPSLPELVAVIVEETCTSSAEYRPTCSLRGAPSCAETSK